MPKSRGEAGSRHADFDGQRTKYGGSSPSPHDAALRSEPRRDTARAITGSGYARLGGGLRRVPDRVGVAGLTRQPARVCEHGRMSLALRRASRRDLPPPAEPAPAEPFTPRQMAVLRHVKLGKANKTIARELDMSESTVKIHLRNIMKKMKAANRTEVACRAHAFETTRPNMSAEQG